MCYNMDEPQIYYAKWKPFTEKHILCDSFYMKCLHKQIYIVIKYISSSLRLRKKGWGMTLPSEVMSSKFSSITLWYRCLWLASRSPHSSLEKYTATSSKVTGLCNDERTKPGGQWMGWKTNKIVKWTHPGPSPMTQSSATSTTGISSSCDPLSPSFPHSPAAPPPPRAPTSEEIRGPGATGVPFSL